MATSKNIMQQTPKQTEVFLLPPPLTLLSLLYKDNEASIAMSYMQDTPASIVSSHPDLLRAYSTMPIPTEDYIYQDH